MVRQAHHERIVIKMKTFLLVGNPNTGKTTLFNALTGLHQKVGNYAGVTVEKKEGTFHVNDQKIRLIDLPGTYSLTPSSPDEEIVVQTLLGLSSEKMSIDGVIVVADATNLERNLYLTTQVIDCGFPTILAVNMIDEAKKKGQSIELELLSKRLGIPVFFTAANKKRGVAELKTYLATETLRAPPSILTQLQLSSSVRSHLEQLEPHLAHISHSNSRRAEALRLLSRDDKLETYPQKQNLLKLCSTIHYMLETEHVDWKSLEADARYQWINHVCKSACSRLLQKPKTSMTDRIDAIVTHRMVGPLFFFLIVGIIFQALFSWATFPMDFIDSFFGKASNVIHRTLPEGPIRSLLADGAVAGIGGIIIFLPQIAFLFFFIALLEDSGYMARAAFVMEQLMAKFGLHGKSFIPLISSFACAIPGIMATRTIESKRDRLITILIAPLMSCSARLPVYTLLIAACIPSLTFLGIFNLQGIVMWSLYLLGVIAAIAVAFLLKKTILKTPSLPFFIELPPYRLPQFSNVFKKTWERSKLFLTNAGTIIFALSIILWFLTSYPKPKNHVAENSFQNGQMIRVASTSDPRGAPRQRGGGTTETTGPVSENNFEMNSSESKIAYSFAGRMGKAIEPLIEPLGFNWKIGIGLIASFAAREVFISTMAIVYSLEDTDETSESLISAIRNDVHADGRKVFNPLVALSLLVFYVLACQCISTVAVVKRETNSWRWPIFMVVYMTLLAYGASFIVYQGGKYFFPL